MHLTSATILDGKRKNKEGEIVEEYLAESNLTLLFLFFTKLPLFVLFFLVRKVVMTKNKSGGSKQL